MESSNKQTICLSPGSVLESFEAEIEVNTNNTVACKTRLDNQELVSSSKDKQVILSIRTSLIKNVADHSNKDNILQDKTGQDNQEPLNSNNEKQIILSILTSLIKNVTDNYDVNSSMDTANSIDMENFHEMSTNKTSETDEIAINHAIVHDQEFTAFENETSPIKHSKRKRDLINQSISLPYFKLSRPDFHEFTNSVAKKLEVPMKGCVQENEEPKVIKELFLQKESLSSLPLFFKQKEEIIRLKQSQYEKCFFKNECVGDKKYDDIVLCEGSSTLKNVRSASNATKESHKIRREDFFGQLKDQMQKKKEAAFDRHKEIQQADEEFYEDLEDYDDSNSSTPSITNEDSCMEIEKDTSESAVENPSFEDHHKLLSSNEEPCENNFDDSESLMNSPPVSLSLPSYQPNGGFVDQNDASSDSCSLDEDKVSFENQSVDEGNVSFDSKFLSEEKVSYEGKSSDKDNRISFGTSSSPYSFTLKNSFALDDSQAPLFGLDDVSTICSGRFLSMDEERPWTPSSDSQINKKRHSNVRCTDEESRSSLEELGLEKNQNNNDAETFSPPLKKYRKDCNLSESGKSPSTFKIKEMMQDACENASDKEDASQIVCINYHTEKDYINTNSNQESYETFDEEDIEEKQIFKRVKKCRPIIEDSDEEEEESLFHKDQPNEEFPDPNQVDDLPNPLKMNDFFDEEAQLSGDEMSSDESEGEEGDDEAEELIVEDIPAEEELKEQVANIYFKHEQDDDARMVKRLQQDFLPEGELYVDGSGRQKTFHWSNNTTNIMPNEVSSESEPEDNIEYPMQQDKIKWRQETSVIQKVSESDASDVDDKQESLSSKKLPVSVIGRVLSSQTMLGVNKQVRSSPITRRHGSLIHVTGSEGLNLNAPSSVQRKTVLFQTLTQSDKRNSGSSQVINGKSVFEKLL